MSKKTKTTNPYWRELEDYMNPSLKYSIKVSLQALRWDIEELREEIRTLRSDPYALAKEWSVKEGGKKL